MTLYLLIFMAEIIMNFSVMSTFKRVNLFKDIMLILTSYINWSKCSILILINAGIIIKYWIKFNLMLALFWFQIKMHEKKTFIRLRKKWEEYETKLKINIGGIHF